MKEVRCDMCERPMIDGDYGADIRVGTYDKRTIDIHLCVMQIGFSSNKLDLCPDCSVGLLQESLKPEIA